MFEMDNLILSLNMKGLNGSSGALSHLRHIANGINSQYK